MRLAILIVALATVLSGCLADGAPAAPTAAADDAAREPEVDPTGDVASAGTNATADAAPPAPRTIEVAIEGRTSHTACAGVVDAWQCAVGQGGAVGDSGENRWLSLDELAEERALVAFEGELTWDARSAASTEIGVYFCQHLGDEFLGCEQARGPSPLAFSWDLADAEGDTFFLSIHGHHEVWTDAGGVIVEAEQPFSLALRLTTTA